MQTSPDFGKVAPGIETMQPSSFFIIFVAGSAEVTLGASLF